MPPIHETDPFVLIGRVVTMDDANPVIDHGAIYVQGNTIVHVLDATAAAST